MMIKILVPALLLALLVGPSEVEMQLGLRNCPSSLSINCFATRRCSSDSSCGFYEACCPSFCGDRRCAYVGFRGK